MQTITTQAKSKSFRVSLKWLVLLLLFIMLGLSVGYWLNDYNIVVRAQNTENNNNSSEPERNGGGKNSQHANQKAREVAKEKWQKAKTEYEKLRTKGERTPDDKKLMDKLEREIKHWKKKMDNTGENHSQQAKK